MGEESKGPGSGVANKDEESVNFGDNRDGDQEQQTVRDRVHTRLVLNHRDGESHEELDRRRSESRRDVGWDE